MLENAQVFARMKPNEKTILIQSLQKYAYNGVVGMCGDGANDQCSHRVDAEWQPEEPVSGTMCGTFELSGFH